MLGKNQPDDLQRMNNRAQTVVSSQTVFMKEVMETGVSPNRKLVTTEPLTTEGLVKIAKGN